MIKWFFTFSLLMWWVTLTDLHILKNPCIPEINPTWSWCMNLLTCCWIQLPSMLLRILASIYISVQFSWVAQSCPTFATPWTAGCQASLSITNSQSLLKHMSIDSVMPSNHLIFCCSLFLPPSVFPSIRISSNESVLHIRWPKYWICSFIISPSNEYSGLISFRMDWLDLLAVQVN